MNYFPINSGNHGYTAYFLNLWIPSINSKFDGDLGFVFLSANFGFSMRISFSFDGQSSCFLCFWLLCLLWRKFVSRVFFCKKKINILNFAVPFDCIHVTKFECHIETIFFRRQTDPSLYGRNTKGNGPSSIPLFVILWWRNTDISCRKMPIYTVYNIQNIYICQNPWQTAWFSLHQTRLCCVFFLKKKERDTKRALSTREYREWFRLVRALSLKALWPAIWLRFENRG